MREAHSSADLTKLYCDQRDRWERGERPLVEQYVRRYPDLATRDEDLLDLIYSEVNLREEMRERPARDEYVRRFPQFAAQIDALWQVHQAVGDVDSRTGDTPHGTELTRASVASLSDRNLLIGLLALQMNFVTSEQLIAAMNAWMLEKASPLEQILLRSGHLAEDTCNLLVAVLNKHVELHRCDLHQSLAAVKVPQEVTAAFGQLADRDLHASLHCAIEQSDVVLAGPFTKTTRALSTSDRYGIIRQHATGGLGEVFLAEDRELNREVALKLIQSRFAHHNESRARFILEAEVTGSLEHPGIVPVYGMGEYRDGRPYYSMRFIRGESLKEAIDSFHARTEHQAAISERTLELRRLLTHFLDACNAIHYAHSRGVIHRDIKPANIMLGKYGETLVVDWGLAKALGKSTCESTHDPTLHPESGDSHDPTQLGMAVGTPAFMSPEQAAGKVDELAASTDVYGLGATLYYLLTGLTPFADKDYRVVLEQVQRGEFVAPRIKHSEVPAPLDAICRRAMALDPANRYASAMDLAEDIRRWMADEVVEAHQESWSARAALVSSPSGLDTQYRCGINLGHMYLGIRGRQGEYRKIRERGRTRDRRRRGQHGSRGPRICGQPF